MASEQDELMPGIIDALGRSNTPLSILTKGTLLRRDLAQLAELRQRVEVGSKKSLPSSPKCQILVS